MPTVKIGGRKVGRKHAVRRGRKKRTARPLRKRVGSLVRRIGRRVRRGRGRVGRV